jgi:endonuclease/exonuclease/phosphatase (EEP) superfamily protein YafD
MLHKISWLLRNSFRFGIPLGLVVLHFFIIVCYARRWDKVAAITIFPLWAWAAGALLVCLIGSLIFRGRTYKWIALIWVLAVVFGADESKFLLRWNREKPLPGPAQAFEGKKVLRVVSLNCKNMSAVTPEELLPWKPDIVLLQEAPYPQDIANLVKKLWPQGQATHVGAYACAVLSRGRLQPLNAPQSPRVPSNFYTTLPTVLEIDGKHMHVVCVHLQGAVTDLTLHRPETWRKHAANRRSRRFEILDVRTRLAINHWFQQGPVLIGGDFNAPAGDAVFRELGAELKNAFDEVGSGWPNTYPNQSPLVRIDHIYSNAALKPVRAAQVPTTNSDHRMLICDFILP